MKGITVWVLRPSYRTRAESSHIDSFVLTGEGIPEQDEPSERCPERRIYKRDGPFITAHVVEKKEGVYAASGNFLYGDSRFTRHVSLQPIPVHDYFESWEQYREMSKD